MYQKSLKSLICLSITSLLLFVGCGNQAGTGYEGDVLATVTGSITNEMSQVPEEGLEVMLVWTVSAGSPDQVVGEHVDVRGDFPASFHLDLYAPPADEALNDYSQYHPAESRVGIAYIIVTPAGVEEVPEEDDQVLGFSEDFMLVYVDRDVQAGSFIERLLHGPPSGIHVQFTGHRPHLQRARTSGVAQGPADSMQRT